MKIILSLMFLFGHLNNIFSQDNEHFYLKGKTELYTSVSFINDGDYSLQIQPSYYLFENFSLGSRINYCSNESIDISLIAEASIPILSNKIIPYILIGYGYNIQVYDVNLHSNCNLKDYHLSKLFTIGSGTKIPIFSKLFIRAEIYYTNRPGEAYESVKNNIFSLNNTQKSKKLINHNINYSVGLSVFI